MIEVPLWETTESSAYRLSIIGFKTATDNLPYCAMQSGWLEVICGSMFSGKSEELIRRLRRAQYGKLSVAVFKPMIDNRYADDSVVSHNGTSIIAHPIKKAEEIFQRIDDSTDVV